MGVRTYALMRVRGSPAVIGTRPLDRWLCVPVFRRVCPYHCTQSVKASRFGVKCRNVFSLSSERMRTQRAKASPSYVSTRRQRCVHEASGIYQMTCVVAARQIRRGNRDTPVRCVHEAAATEVDTDVIDAMRAHAEEHEVPGLKFAEGHRLRGALLLGGGARNGDAGARVHVERKSAAVKAANVGATELVRRADERSGGGRDRGPRLAPHLCHRGRARHRRTGPRCTRRDETAAAQEYEREGGEKLAAH